MSEAYTVIPSNPNHFLRLVGTFGSNKVMAGELSRLVRRARDDVRMPVPERLGAGSVAYPFDRRIAQVAVRYHRTSARVLWQVMSSQATRLEPLYADLLTAMVSERPNWFWDGATITVRAFGVQDFAAGERQVVGVVKNAIVDGAAKQGIAISVDPERPDISIDVRLLEGNLLVSIDLAGTPMHQRGYRQAAGEAPLREDLAAMMLMLARYDARSDVLIDPMAGAGTLVIEAAAMASARGVWCSGRTPACSRLPEFAHDWPRTAPPLFADTQPKLIYNDIDPQALGMARANADTAGVLGQIELITGDFRRLTRQRVEASFGVDGAATTGLILSNPPYGHRLGDVDTLPADYRALGSWCGAFKGYRAGFLVEHPDFEAAFGRRPVLKKPLPNGPLKSVFYLYEF
jgi:23S rRNA G2445 N2-methylase RlmL